MIVSSSLIALFAVVLSSYIAALSLRDGRGAPAQRYFAAMNALVALWCVTAALQDFLPNESSLFAAGYASYRYLLHAGITIASTLAPLAWLAFCVHRSRACAFAKPSLLPLGFAHAAYGLATGLTNPSHGLFLSEVAGATVIGPLYVPWAAGGFAMVFAGAAMTVCGAVKAKTAETRRQATSLMAAITVPIAITALWSLQSRLGLEIPLAAAPTGFAMMNVILAWEVFTGGLAGIVPRARHLAFDAMSDAAIVIDTHARIVDFNSAATELFHEIEPGQPVERHSVTLARHADKCLSEGVDSLHFEAVVNGAVYWGRVRLMSESKSSRACVLLLSDLTDLRAAQTELERLGKAGADLRRISNRFKNSA